MGAYHMFHPIPVSFLFNSLSSPYPSILDLPALLEPCMFLLAFIHYGRALLQSMLPFHIILLLSLMNQAPGFTLVHFLSTFLLFLLYLSSPRSGDLASVPGVFLSISLLLLLLLLLSLFQTSL